MLVLRRGLILSRLAHQTTQALVTARASSSKAASARLRALQSGPSLGDFISGKGTSASSNQDESEFYPRNVPYVAPVEERVGGKVYIETYGCQMSFADSEVCLRILNNAGYHRTMDIDESDVVLAMTCSIRDNAEQKIWQRLDLFKKLKSQRGGKHPLQIGVLGCMAERLKHKLLDADKLVDVVAGPDAYRDLPRLLSESYEGQAQVNVLLSMDETYADIAPVRLNKDSKTAFVSIQRGCDNMCSYCIVPFTRGRERSRPISSIVEEVRQLSEQGVKEVTLLGQNVNSYRDTSDGTTTVQTQNSRGFKTIYKPKVGGRRFAELLARVAEVDPEIRVRFTSPHPKDFPDELLEVIRDNVNVCKHLHLPAQSGSSAVLELMRRGYTRESYLDLVHHVRNVLPDVTITSDFISGFCGETEEDHEDTLSLMRQVRYDMAYMFMYSLREKTNAHRRLKDDVPHDVKKRRHREVADILYEGAAAANAERVGRQQLVLVEKTSKRSKSDWMGRTDGNTTVVFPNQEVVCAETGESREPQPGDYVVVDIESASSITLRGKPLSITTLNNYFREADDVQHMC